MGTTVFFEETLKDMKDKSISLDLEFGRTTFYGDNLIYLKVDGKAMILDEEAGKRLTEAMDFLSGYLGYDR
jgi:hypothetical protein